MICSSLPPCSDRVFRLCVILGAFLGFLSRRTLLDIPLPDIWNLSANRASLCEPAIFGDEKNSDCTPLDHTYTSCHPCAYQYDFSSEIVTWSSFYTPQKGRRRVYSYPTIQEKSDLKGQLLALRLQKLWLILQSFVGETYMNLLMCEERLEIVEGFAAFFWKTGKLVVTDPVADNLRNELWNFLLYPLLLRFLRLRLVNLESQSSKNIRMIRFLVLCCIFMLLKPRKI